MPASRVTSNGTGGGAVDGVVGAVGGEAVVGATVGGVVVVVVVVDVARVVVDAAVVVVVEREVDEFASENARADPLPHAAPTIESATNTTDHRGIARMRTGTAYEAVHPRLRAGRTSLH